MKYRLYIDEGGNSDIGSSHDPNHRYLSLTGIIIDNEHHTKIVSPAVETLKYTYFTSTSDKPVILHRKELMNKNHPFEVLRDPAIANAFDRDLLYLLLKESFERVYVKGSDFVNPQIFSLYLTSRQLKLQKKRDDIAGLQLADLIAHPSFRGSLARKEHRSLPDTFGGKIEMILEASKYVRSHRGLIDGYGRKGLP